MSVEPGEELGCEIHADTDQFSRIEEGKRRGVIDGVTHKVKAGDGVVVPARAHHNVICTGNHALMILLNFPWSAAVVLGIILAIELISNGVLLVAISLLAK